MIEAKEYSIWLEPEGKARDDLARVIKSLSTKYSTPVFDPHVTLFGGIMAREQEVVSWIEEVARRVAPYLVSVTGEVDCEEHWTKSLFVKVAETVEVLGANHVARTILGLEYQEQYHPHLSLMYVWGIPIEERLQVARSLDPKSLTHQFYIEKFHLYRTQGGVEDWEKIVEFKLVGSN